MFMVVSCNSVIKSPPPPIILLAKSNVDNDECFENEVGLNNHVYAK